MTTELTISAAALHGLFRDLMATAGTDAMLPALNGVLLHTEPVDDDTMVLVGTSTDRFILGQAHEPIQGGHLPETFLGLPALRVLIAALQPRVDHYDEDDEVWESAPSAPTGVVRLVRDGDTLAVIGDQTVRVEVWSKVEFVPAKHLSRLFALRTGSTAQIAPRYLRVLAAIANRRAGGVVFTMQAPKQPVQVHIGERYRALAAPIKPESMPGAPPLFLPPSVPREPALKRQERAS